MNLKSWANATLYFFSVVGMVTLTLDASAMSSKEAGECAKEWKVDLKGYLKNKKTPLGKVYEKNGFCPLWFHGDELLEDKRKAMQEAMVSELRPLGFRLSSVSEACPLQKKKSRTERCLSEYWVDLVVRLTPYGSEPKLDNRWTDPSLKRQNLQLGQIIYQSLLEGHFRDALLELQPKFADYQELRRKLHDLFAQQKRFGSKPTLVRRGKGKAQIVALVHRLYELGYWKGSPEGQTKMDDRVKSVLQEFQESHDLEVDGKLGRNTLAKINEPFSEKIKRVQLNLHRMRWLPPTLEDSLLVDLPGFKVDLLGEGGNVRLSSPTIVGKKDWATPTLAERLTYVVVNPDWTVPDSIATEEIIPKIVEDPEYLAKVKYEIVDKETGDKLSPDAVADIDWEDYVEGEEQPTFRFVRPPGEANPLGPVKLMFPNPHAVYLHGTPDKALFDKKDRAFSHGCIRVERIEDLAREILASHGEDGALEAFNERAQKPEIRNLKLKKPVPVYFVYWTTRVVDGRLHFRDDVYEEDGKALAQWRRVSTRIAD